MYTYIFLAFFPFYPPPRLCVCFGGGSNLPTFPPIYLSTRLSTIKAELDRVVTFDGDVINSSAIHGTDQRWAKPVLIGELRREIDIFANKIYDAKVGR